MYILTTQTQLPLPILISRRQEQVLTLILTHIELATLALFDPLTQAGNWSIESNTSSGGSCRFVSGGYQISESNPNGFYSCNDTSSPFDNFVFEVKMTINQGDCGGINLREDTSTGKQYEIGRAHV